MFKSVCVCVCIPMEQQKNREIEIFTFEGSLSSSWLIKNSPISAAPSEADSYVSERGCTRARVCLQWEVKTCNVLEASGLQKNTLKGKEPLSSSWLTPAGTT